MEEKKSFLDKIKGIMKGTRTKKDSVDAMDAFFQTKYGDIKSPEHYVEVAQQHITRMIKTRMNPERYNPDEPRFRSYCCVVDFDREMNEHIDEILEPFKEAGFDIIKISGAVDGIKSEQTYLISWDKRA